MLRLIRSGFPWVPFELHRLRLTWNMPGRNTLVYREWLGKCISTTPFVRWKAGLTEYSRLKFTPSRLLSP